MPEHQLTQLADGAFRCTACLATWKHAPRSRSYCPGLPVYKWQSAPEYLKTRKQLQTLHKKPGGPARAYLPGRRGVLYDLFDEREAVPTKAISEKQRAALEHAQKYRTCRRCGKEVLRTDFDQSARLCYACENALLEADYRAQEERERLRILRARDRAIRWAREMVERPDTWVIIDTETTGLEQAEIIQIAMLSSGGTLLFDGTVKPSKPVEEGAIRIHHITNEMLAEKPDFAVIYPLVADVMGGKEIVAYNVRFDQEALNHTCKVHDLPTISTREWKCAMNAYAEYYGEWSNYWQDFKYQALPGGDHTAAGDCRATLELIQWMAACHLSDCPCESCQVERAQEGKEAEE